MSDLTLAKLIKSAELRKSQKLVERNSHAETLRDLAAADFPDEAAGARAQVEYNKTRAAKNQLDAEIDSIDIELAELRATDAQDAEQLRQSNIITPTGVTVPAYDQVARVGAEARTYSRQAALTEERSFFGDMYAAELRGDYAARDRLARHSQEVVVEREMSARALATGGLAGLVPPQYLVEQYAAVLRNGRPVANTLQKLQIPSTGMSFLVPRGTTGASVGVQATENTALSTTDEVWANITVPVCTIGGYAPVSRQSLERGTPGVDQIIFGDLLGAYAAALDALVLSGTGASGQMLGILTTAGITQMTAYGAAITSAAFTSKLAGAIASVAGGGATIKPRAIFMHPRRWGWYSTLVDTTGRPLVSTEGAGPNNANAINSDPGGYGGDGNDNTTGTNVVGYIQGLPVITDASIPTNVGTGPEDQLIVMDTQNSILWEDGDGMPQTMSFEQTAGTSLTVTLVAYGYGAFTAGRYPTSVSVVGGNATTAGWGQIAPVY